MLSARSLPRCETTSSPRTGSELSISCHATRAAGGIKLGPQGGHGHVRFASVEEARRALVSLNHSYMGNRYIELFWAS